MTSFTPSRRTLLAGMAVLLGSGGVHAGEEAPVKGGTLVINLEPEPSSFLFNAATANILAASVNDGLIDYDEAFRPVPSLAQSWEQAPDGRTITFHLRQDVRWHDGEKFTSADVQYSVMEVVKKINPRGGTAYNPVVAVDQPGNGGVSA